MRYLCRINTVQTSGVGYWFYLHCNVLRKALDSTVNREIETYGLYRVNLETLLLLLLLFRFLGPH